MLQGQEDAKNESMSETARSCSTSTSDDQLFDPIDLKPAFDRNSDVCSICQKVFQLEQTRESRFFSLFNKTTDQDLALLLMQTYSGDLSPLLLCDGCPRVVHLVCAELDWCQLPDADGLFYCSRCQAKDAAQVGKLLLSYPIVGRSTSSTSAVMHVRG